MCAMRAMLRGVQMQQGGRHGRPVARLVPANQGIDRGQAQAALQRMRDRAKRAGLGPFDWETLKADRDASRP